MALAVALGIARGYAPPVEVFLVNLAVRGRLSFADCNRVDVDVVDPAKVDRRSPANLDAIGSFCRLREHDEAGRGFIGPDRKDILPGATVDANVDRARRGVVF